MGIVSQHLDGAVDHEDQDVTGHCPMGCGELLHLRHGTVTCKSAYCPRPDAAAEILADGEVHHVVTLGEVDFTVRHPLRERLDDALLDCTVTSWLRGLDAAPQQPGVYRLWWAGTGATAVWEPLPGHKAAALPASEPNGVQS